MIGKSAGRSDDDGQFKLKLEGKMSINSRTPLTGFRQMCGLVKTIMLIYNPMDQAGLPYGDPPRIVAR